MHSIRFACAGWLAVQAVATSAMAAGPGFPEADALAFIDRHCSTCHNDVDREGGLDLTSLKYAPEDPENFLTWIKVHDRVQAGEMPPKEKRRPEAAATAGFVKSLDAALVAADEQAIAQAGRAVDRRLNRTEYENTLRDLFQAPYLLIQEKLPEDGIAASFNKVSRALDVSYVHLAQYMSAAEYAMKQVITTKFVQPETRTTRNWARNNFRFSNQGGNPNKGRFPVLDHGPDLEVMMTGTGPEGGYRLANSGPAFEFGGPGRQPLFAGDANPARRDKEAMGFTSSHYRTGMQTEWNEWQAPVTGRYHIRLSGYTIWVGPWGTRFEPARPGPVTGGEYVENYTLPAEWHMPNHWDITEGRRHEPIHVYGQWFQSQSVSTTAHKIGQFDLTPDENVAELKGVYLEAGEKITTDPIRFLRPRPGFTNTNTYSNPLAQRDGMPGVAFKWMEVEGPLYDESTTAGYRLLFDNLPLKKAAAGAPGVAIDVVATAVPTPAEAARAARQGARGGPGLRPVKTLVEVESANPTQDAERLLRRFLPVAYRRPAEASDVQRYLALFQNRFERGLGFAGAMMASYKAILASEKFLYLGEEPGRLDARALASRLALFLWNSQPDAALLARAAKGELHRPEVLRAETDRLLADPRSRRFVDAFCDYWLELRRMNETTPDINLYADYYIDDALAESAAEETQLFFAELVQRNLPARNIIDSDFAILNERLATHYGLPGVEGAHFRPVTLPAKSVRGGIMTQASVLKVTANGTTTSPVLRGKWIMERIVGFEIPLPPATVPAVEPDVRGATTIREQLDKHRADESCAACHRNIDPPGFALESFDVFGGYRDRYRAIAAKGQTPALGFGKNGWPLQYYFARPVDPSGQMADGRSFNDVRDLKRLLLQHDVEKVARNLARQLTIFATGSPVRYSDRAKIDQILAKTRASDYGVRDLIHEIIQSELFRNK
jgi:mono/diheme cytochrome c family protein